MIRYAVSRADLEQQIEAEKPGWLKRARARTKKFVAAGKYQENDSIWSEVKAVYMRLQHNKCAYCERWLPTPDHGGAIEHDLEHFRPKGDVEAWPPAEGGDDGPATYSFPTGDAFPGGYFWLAYEPMNFLTSCKKCNSCHKCNFFPIAGTRGKVGTDPAGLANEQPFLIYPLGSGDDNPEELITFSGITAIPRQRSGPRWRRAPVIIELFDLNGREELRRDRAGQLIRLANALAVLESSHAPPNRKKLARRDIERLQHPTSAQTSCIRAACDLYQRAPKKAWEIFEAADDYLESLS